MKYLVYIFFVFPFCLYGQTGIGKFDIKEASPKDVAVYKLSDNYMSRYSPRKKYPNKNLKSNGATFVPIYVNVPDHFKEAIEFTFDAISDFISSDIPINVEIIYTSLDEGVLAQAGPSSYAINFPGAAYYDTFYPIALAEKLAGLELNGEGVIDLIISINSDEPNWNVVPNNASIGNRFDLASILMHEVIHGLGFTAGSAYGETGLGELTSSAFSRFIENGDGTNLLSGIRNSSQDMGDQFTSGNLFFNNTEDGEKYRLYAPQDYQSGSSISHLDRTVYQGSPNRMMTPTADRGDVNYNPGISEDIMHAIGWDITAIVHNPKIFSEDVNEDYLITAEVNSDIGFDTSSFVIHYSTDSFKLEDIVVSLDFDPTNDEFSFLLPATGEEIQYQYYFELDERSGQERLVPVRANEMFFQYNLGADNTAPQISGHVPIVAINETDVEFTLKVNDIDDFFTGADTTTLSAVISLNGNLDTIPFEVIPGEFGDFFEAKYERPQAFELTDELRYKIILLDKAINRNQANLPLRSFYRVAINEVLESVVTYVNDFDAETSDFSGSGFSIRSQSRFDNPAIHSEHPYRNAGEGSTLNFTFELKNPILIDEENPVISFDEVVIVEPGEEGTACRGSNCPLEFWDYVVVEGKKVGGTSWLAFHNAYDARKHADFLTAYNNSQTGSSELFKPRVINMVDNGNFDVGDQVFVRFRLFSDPFAVGWGWAIDNLEIQPIGTRTLDEKYIDTFELYPNPIPKDQILNLNIQLKEKFTGELSLVNIIGQQLIKTKIYGKNSINAKWDLSRLNTGIYFAQLKNKAGVSLRKLIVT